MTRSLRLITPLALLFALSACKEIKVKDGEVPDEYRAMAQAYMGTYSGVMEGSRATVTLALQGRKVVLTYKDANGTDILDPRCDSKIGNLQSVGVSKVRNLTGQAPAAYKLDSATFAFDANRCWGSVEGREVVLDFSKKAAHIRVDASILLREEWQRDCRINPGFPRGGLPPSEICNQQPIATFATGRFSN
jgi:hypothetical protein